MNKYSRIDLAKLAAYIDGDGCIRVHRSFECRREGVPSYSTRVSVINTDPRLPEWCVERFGGSISVERRRRKGGHLVFIWHLSGKRAADVLQACLRYFTLKYEQAQLAIIFQRVVLTKRGCKLSELDIKGRDWCYSAMKHLHRKYQVPYPESAPSGKESSYVQ